jgi:hypothetical protein
MRDGLAGRLSWQRFQTLTFGLPPESAFWRFVSEREKPKGD